MDALLARFPSADKRTLQASIRDMNASKTVTFKVGDLACLLYGTLAYVEDPARSAKIVHGRDFARRCGEIINSINSPPEITQTNTKPNSLRQPRIDQWAGRIVQSPARPQHPPRPANPPCPSPISGSIQSARHQRRSSSSDLEIIGGPFPPHGNTSMSRLTSASMNQLDHYGDPPPYETVTGHSLNENTTLRPTPHVTPTFATPNTTSFSRLSAPEFRKRTASPFAAGRSQRQRIGQSSCVTNLETSRPMGVQGLRTPLSPTLSEDADEFGGDDVFDDMTASQVQRSFP